MQRVVRIFVLALIACVAVTLVSGTAFAKKSKKSAKPLGGILNGVEWGQSKDKVMERIEAIIMAEYAEKSAEIGDMGKRDKLRKSYVQRVERIEKSHKEFKSGERSGLEVSIVASEFVPDNQESVLVVREEIATKYYFFLSDELYKVAVAYDPDYIGEMAFDSFVAAITKKYGDPADEGVDAEGYFIMATWEDSEGTRLRATNAADHYDTYLMSFTSVEREAKVSEKHDAANVERNTEPSVSADIDALVDKDGDANSGNAADAILGGGTAIDLKAGLPQEDIDAMAEGEMVGGDHGDKGGTSDKKKKKTKKKKVKKGEFKDVEQKEGGKGIIIY